VALLAHGASRTPDGEPTWNVLESLGARVVRLFAPEHGLASRAGAGEDVADDTLEGRPVVSLYGQRRKPAPEHLADVDAVVVDLQDVGVRFYTYAGKMLDVIEAALAAGVGVVVLDRPNPLGGDLVEGPAAEPGERGTTFARTPGTLVHGLTLGEIAAASFPKVRVVRMKGWTRAMRWPATHLRWVRPSPNLRTEQAALAYPGTALLEGTNVSEGRGTDAPFLLLGAPWVDAAALARVESAGFALEPTTFTPAASAAAPSPKHAGVACHGVRVHVVDAERVSGYQLGVTLLRALRRQEGFAWLEDGRNLDRLVASGTLRAAIESGADAPDDAAAWRAERRGMLLYGR
jgi:uncharacterized protein YbbC (DUF1343 family)